MDTARIEQALQLIREKRPGAEDELLRLANERVELLSQKFLRAFPTVAAFYETGDVRQLALMRARRTLEKVDVSDARHFYRLLAKKVRETLLDLKRQLHGPQGRATHERPLQSDADESRWFDRGPVDETHEPGKLAQWLELHAAIEALPEPHRQMFDMLWYNELTQEEAASVLEVSVRHVRRLWRDAKLALIASFPDLNP